METRNFCQSCSMPLSEDVLGTEKDGGKNEEYCMYCYQNGAFTSNSTMEEMVDISLPHMLEANPGLGKEQARSDMLQFFKTLKRWK